MFSLIKEDLKTDITFSFIFDKNDKLHAIRYTGDYKKDINIPDIKYDNITLKSKAKEDLVIPDGYYLKNQEISIVYHSDKDEISYSVINTYENL